MSVNIIGVTTAANLVAINAVLEAMGHGPNNISRRVTTVANPSETEQPTHLFMSYQGAGQEMADTFLRFANADLPPLPMGVVWGEDGVISAQDALVAIQPSNFVFGIFNDGLTAIEQVDAVLASMGLHIIPDPL